MKNEKNEKTKSYILLHNFAGRYVDYETRAHYNQISLHTSSGRIASQAQRCMERIVSPDGSALASSTSSAATPVSCRLLPFRPPVLAAASSPLDSPSL